MAGSATYTHRYSAGLLEVSVAWTSDASGDCNVADNQGAVSGRLISAVFVPGTGGSQPTASYDAVLNVDSRTYDILNARGANLDNANPATQWVAMGTVTEGVLKLVVSNAGNAKSGTVYLWFTGGPS